MNGPFMPAPSVILTDKAATLEALKNYQDWWNRPHPFKWLVKSQWLCDELNRMEQDGYVYNAEALRAIEKAEGIGPYDENGSPLSLLIYNAQGFRRSDALRAQGFEPGTPEMLQAAFEQGLKIELYHDSILGGSSVNSLTVKQFDGKLYAMQPRKRRYAVDIIGKPVRLEGTGPKTPLPATLERKSMVRIGEGAL
jgi:hypothetical protein